MIGKLIILGVIAVAVIVLAPNLFKSATHASIETIKQHIDPASHNQGNSTTTVGYGGMLANSSSANTGAAPNSTENLANTSHIAQVTPQGSTNQTYTGQVFENTNGTCQVSVPGMAQTINGQQEITHVIQVPNCNLPVNKPVQVTSTTPKQNSTQSPSPGNSIQVTSYGSSSNDGNSGAGASTSSPAVPAYFQTVQLSAVNQGSSALLSYDDTTGQTTQVTVTMKNSEKVLFSGTFYTSQFHTEVNDVPNTPHVIEMTIQNAIYGTLHASVYAPPNIQNSTISGIFTN